MAMVLGQNLCFGLFPEALEQSLAEESRGSGDQNQGTPGHRSSRRRYRFKVLTISMVTVISPTPPGTGV